jgi:putative aldouronate transport system substrate-binding protein
MKNRMSIIFAVFLVLTCPFLIFGGGASQGGQGRQASGAAPVSLSVEIFDRGNMPASYGSPIDNRWTNYVKDNFAKPANIDLSYVAVPRSQETDKINVMMASRSAPDIIFTYNGSLFANYASQGGLTDLTNLIPANAPELQKIWGEEVLRFGRLEGRQFAIYAKRTWLANSVSYIRKDWLDKIGYKLNTYKGHYAITTDDLFTVLQQCIARNVSGKGASNTFGWGVFGTGSTAIQSPWTDVRQAFYEQDKITEEMIATLPQFVWPGAKEGFRFINRMYNAGLMDPDFALQKDHQLFMARVANGQVGFWTGTDGFGTSETDPQSNFVYMLYQNNPEAEFVGVNVLNNKTGKPAYRYRYSPTGMIIMIPSFSKAAPQALQYLNWLAQPDKAGDVIFGVEGEHYRMLNGIRTPIDMEYNAKSRMNPGDLAIMYNGDPDPEMDLAVRLIGVSDPLKPLVQAYYDIGNENTWENYTFLKSIESETKYSSNLRAKSDEIYTQSIMARSQDFDAVYDRLVAEYLAIGGQEIIDERIKAYREQNR